MKITPMDRKLLKNIPEKPAEPAPLDETQGLNRFLRLYIINCGYDQDSPASAAATVEAALMAYAESELLEKGIVEFPPSDMAAYETESGEQVYVSYFEEMNAWQNNIILDLMLQDIQQAGEKLNTAKKRLGLRGVIWHLIWALVFAAVGYGVYRFGTSEFYSTLEFLSVLLTLPLMGVILVCGIAALFNLVRMFAPSGADRAAVNSAAKELQEHYWDVLRYIRLRALWYQCIYDTNETPEYLQRCQKQLDQAVQPWKRYVK